MVVLFQEMMKHDGLQNVVSAWLLSGAELRLDAGNVIHYFEIDRVRKFPEQLDMEPLLDADAIAALLPVVVSGAIASRLHRCDGNAGHNRALSVYLQTYGQKIERIVCIAVITVLFSVFQPIRPARSL